MSLKLVNGQWVGKTGGVDLESLRGRTVTKRPRCKVVACSSTVQNECPYRKAVTRSMQATHDGELDLTQLIKDVSTLFSFWGEGEIDQDKVRQVYAELTA